MTRRTSLVLGFSSFLMLVITGCMPKMTVEEMKAHMPQRPAELDNLNAFAGKWEFSGKVSMAGLEEELDFSGTADANWDGDGWYLVSRGIYKMGDFDEMQGMEVWMYDAKAKKYRSSWIDGMGSFGIGTSTYDEETRTWRMKATSHGPFGKTTMKGKVKIVDDNTMEWSMTEHAMGGLMKTMEMTGTSKRR